MKKQLQRQHVGTSNIAPPHSRILKTASLLFMGIFLVLGTRNFSYGQLSELPVSNMKLQFETGKADFDSPEWATLVANELISRFEDTTITVLLVRIRTQKNEFVGKEDRQLLQIARANAIKSLFIPNGALERDQLQVHSSIEYNQDPPIVTFELYREDGSLVAKLTDFSANGLIAKQ
jgi:hypothetical protein